jgi:membrane-bound lytic murein transglycosylase A
MTGYYEPQLEARRQREDGFQVPLYRLPPFAPTAPRAELESSGRLRGLELLWLQDPLAAFFLEVQGSGRLQLGDGQRVRVSYAGSNGQPYRSIGRWLVEQGELPADHVSMQAISEWARAHPQRVRELLDQNPRMVFFREQSLGRDDPGPIGSLGVPLTPGVSVAVDPAYLPLGAPLLLRLAAAQEPPATAAASGAGADATVPLMDTAGGPGTDARDDGAALLPARPVVAQDTGGAIRGPLRVDWYWGQGPEAGEIAGRQRASASVRVLVPRGIDPASLR